MVGRRVLIIGHQAAHAARGSIKTTHILYFAYSSLQNTICIIQVFRDSTCCI